jgi:hypothetical protein
MVTPLGVTGDFNKNEGSLVNLPKEIIVEVGFIPK